MGAAASMNHPLPEEQNHTTDQPKFVLPVMPKLPLAPQSTCCTPPRETTAQASTATPTTTTVIDDIWFTKIPPSALLLIEQLERPMPEQKKIHVDDPTTISILKRIAVELAVDLDIDFNTKNHGWQPLAFIPSIKKLINTSNNQNSETMSTPRNPEKNTKSNDFLSNLKVYFTLLNSESTLKPASKRAVLHKVYKILSIGDKDLTQFLNRTRIKELQFSGHQLNFVVCIEYKKLQTSKHIQPLVHILNHGQLDPASRRTILRSIISRTKGGRYLTSPVNNLIKANGLEIPIENEHENEQTKTITNTPPGPLPSSKSASESSSEKIHSDKILPLVTGFTLLSLFEILSQGDCLPVEERAVLKEISYIITGNYNSKNFEQYISSCGIYLVFKSAIRCGILQWDLQTKQYITDTNVLKSVSFSDISLQWA